MNDTISASGVHLSEAFEDFEPARSEDRKRARHQHHRRFLVQLFGWGAKIAAAAIVYPLLALYTSLNLAACQERSIVSIGCESAAVAFFIPPLALFVLLFGNWLWHFLRHHAWEVAMGNAQQFTNRENVARGYTELFSIYVRTKRRSYHLQTWALVGFLYAFTGAMIAMSAVPAAMQAHVVYWLPEALSAAAGLGLMALAYCVGSAYLPGDVIVRHTLALIIYAVSNITDPNLARRQAAKESDHFVRTNPWWFYAG
jgi:hypothetical protein